MLAEMLAMLRYEIASGELKCVSVSNAEFSALGQQERIAVLRSLGLIDARSETLFSGIRGRRRRYLHTLRDAERQARGDAKDVYRAVVELAQFIFRIGIAGKSVTLHPDVVRFLWSHSGEV
jgi:hypothetical protein